MSNHGPDPPPYDPERISAKIADHSYEAKVVSQQRFHKERYGPPVPVNDKRQFQTHIEQTITNGQTRCFKACDGRDLFYNRATNTTVIVNPNRDANGEQHGGTCYRDKGFEREWQRLKEREGESRKRARVKEPVREVVGGFHALYGPEQDRERDRADRMARVKEQLDQRKLERGRGRKGPSR